MAFFKRILLDRLKSAMSISRTVSRLHKLPKSPIKIAFEQQHPSAGYELKQRSFLILHIPLEGEASAISAYFHKSAMRGSFPEIERYFRRSHWSWQQSWQATTPEWFAYDNGTFAAGSFIQFFFTESAVDLLPNRRLENLQVRFDGLAWARGDVFVVARHDEDVDSEIKDVENPMALWSALSRLAT